MQNGLRRFPGKSTAPYILAATFLLTTTAVWGEPATLMVGTDQQYKQLSEAALAARPGDTIKISPGTYHDCAVWQTSGITIEGTGPGVRLTGKTCQRKAIFVIRGDGVTVKNLTFQGARVPDENGAGIRVEGRNLVIDNSRFIANQNGILAGDDPVSSIVVRNSEFDHNGACIKACAHGVYVGHVRLLRIEHSRFFDTRAAHHVKSRAARTEIIENRIEDGPDGTASFEVDIPNGGAVVMVGNVLQKGPKNQNHTAAVSIGEEGVSQPTPELVFKHNVLTNDGPPTAFINNLTATPARLNGNTLKGNPIKPLIGAGTVR